MITYQLDDGAFERLQPMLTSRENALAPRAVVAALLSFGLTPTDGVTTSTSDDSSVSWQVVARAGQMLIVVTAEGQGYEWQWRRGDLGNQVNVEVSADCYTLDRIESVTVTSPRIYPYQGGDLRQQNRLEWDIQGWTLSIRGRTKPIEFRTGWIDERVDNFCRDLIGHLGGAS